MPVYSPNYWGHICKEDAYYKPIMALDHHGNEYIANTHGPFMWKLKCECGHQWEIEADDFPGRRKLRSCGRPECPHTLRDEPPRIKEAKAVYTSYMSCSTMDRVVEYAKANRLSKSAALERLLVEGLVSKLVNE